MKKERGNLIVSGSGGASGGPFDKVVINGHGRVDGDLECVAFTCNGSSTVDGKLKAQSVRISGSSELNGDVECDKMTVHGHVDFDGNVVSKEISLYGHASVKGNVAGDNVDVKGVVDIKGDCEAEVFSIKGGFTIEGLLNAGIITIESYHNCRAKEIGGETIRVHKPRVSSLLSKVISLFHPSEILSAESIEGDDVDLEYVKAKVVRGNKVRIGTGCEIERVEYKEDFHQAKDAIVRLHQKI
jgi:cytoskeletal protein CcmA (bactofilin family)